MNPQDEALSVTQELKQCPFCDGEACLREYDEDHPFEPFGLIVDHREDCFLHYSRPFDEIVTAWNTRLSHSTPGDAEVRSISVADEWNVYMTEAVNNAPEPLRKLGEYLAELLDEDQWKTAERYLNGALLATPSGRAQAWLPIETAPKDGSEILLGAPAQMFRGQPTAPRSTIGHWMTEEECREPIGDCGGECRCPEYKFHDPYWLSWDGGFTEDNPPTHWQPLPAAPPAQDQTKGDEA